MSINFQTISVKFAISKKTSVKNWISKVIKKEKRKESKIVFIFCSDNELLAINKEFLNHNTLTDIITFDYSKDKTISGEIYVSIERVEDNANFFDISFENELHRVIIHGVLHLCGYKDKTTAQKKEMRLKESLALRLLKD